MPDLSPLVLVLLTLAGVAAGFVDSIAGGGGMITVPALLAAGLPPHFALGTNKLQSSFGSFTAALSYRQGGLVSFRRAALGVLFAAAGAALGTLCIQALSPRFLDHLVPALLVSIFIYMWLSPHPGDEDRLQRLAEPLFYLAVGLTMGFYDGFFGPGTGSIWTIAFVLLLGHNLKKATAHTKLMNFTSNAVSLSVFALGGHVLLLPGLLMGLGQLLGALLGSRMMIRRHVRFVRSFFLAVVGLTVLKLAWSAWVEPLL